jgi:hypothetical protein
MKHLSDIQIRDPFVLPVASEKSCYLFGTTDMNPWGGPGTGFDYYRSTDLENWEGPIAAFRPAAGFWGTTQFWAPEVHAIGDRYYLVATFNAPGKRLRGSQIFAADCPRGPYQPMGEPITPANWSCLDATLWTEPDGSLWTVFSHEWLQVHDGGIWARRLDSGLHPEGALMFLFNASAAPWVRPTRTTDPGCDREREFPCYVTDGPFLHRTTNGTLLMLWSSFGANGYAMGLARSTTGSVLGPWEHEPAPLVSDDGGHGMIFRAFDGRLFLACHRPNDSPNERGLLLPIREAGDRLQLL